MKSLLACLILLSPLASLATSAQTLDCQQSKNARACAQNAMTNARNNLLALTKDLNKQLKDFNGMKSAQQFARIEGQWEQFADKQCVHVHELYGKGSLGPIADMTCREQLYKERISTLKDLYDEVLNPR